jgi:PAS domain S-box-containing protein
MRERVSRLFRNAQAGPSQDLLMSALEELQIALEELQVAEEVLRTQTEQQLISHETLDTERRYYCDLFEQAPVAYLVTSTEGTIRQANRPAATLLKTQARQLIGRSLALFVPEGSRRAFRARIPQLCESEGPHEWYIQLQAWEGEPLDVLLLIGVTYDSTGRPAALRWLVHQLAIPVQQGAEGDQFELEQRVSQLDRQLAALRAQIRELARQADAAALQERAVGS